MAVVQIIYLLSELIGTTVAGMAASSGTGVGLMGCFLFQATLDFGGCGMIMFPWDVLRMRCDLRDLLPSAQQQLQAQ